MGRLCFLAVVQCLIVLTGIHLSRSAIGSAVWMYFETRKENNKPRIHNSDAAATAVHQKASIIT